MKSKENKINKDKKTSKFDKIKNSKGYRAFSVIKNTIAWFFLIIIAIAVVVFVVTRISGEVPSVLGYTIFRVSSGSMEPELMVGDIIVDKGVDSPDDIAVGDVISYDGAGDLQGKIITHKVIVAPHKESNGETMLQTQGVANPIADDPVEFSKVRGKYLFKIPYIDKLYNLFLSLWGLIIFLLLIILIFLDEIIKLIRILANRDTPDVDIDEIIRRIKEENEEKELTEEKSSDSSQSEFKENGDPTEKYTGFKDE